MNLEDKLYTSTEVAEILGVSLRSVYRYLDEDKLQAEVKTATGRHRFTKQNILDFLYPQGENKSQTSKDVQKATEVEIEEQVVPHIEPVASVPEEEEEVTAQPVEPESAPEPAPAPQVEEEPIDWLEKFRAAASKYQAEEAEQPAPKEDAHVEEVSSMTNAPAVEEKKPTSGETQTFYYRSLIGGLKDIAQNIDKSAKKASIDYAFTMNAGLSLHKPIKPFSVLHAYVRPEDKEFFERMLNLVSADTNGAQLCLLVSSNKKIFDNSKEMHGLRVVSDVQLKSDLMENGEEELAKEFESVMS